MVRTPSSSQPKPERHRPDDHSPVRALLRRRLPRAKRGDQEHARRWCPRRTPAGTRAPNVHGPRGAAPREPRTRSRFLVRRGGLSRCGPRSRRAFQSPGSTPRPGPRATAGPTVEMSPRRRHSIDVGDVCMALICKPNPVLLVADDDGTVLLAIVPRELSLTTGISSTSRPQRAIRRACRPLHVSDVSGWSSSAGPGGPSCLSRSARAPPPRWKMPPQWRRGAPGYRSPGSRSC